MSVCFPEVDTAYTIFSTLPVNNIVLYCNKLTLLSQWLAYDDLNPQRCYRLTRVTKMCEMTHLHSTRRVYNSRRGHLKTQKHQNPCRLGFFWGRVKIITLPRPGSRPLIKPQPPLSA